MIRFHYALILYTISICAFVFAQNLTLEIEYEKAISLEEVHGHLEEAIEIYQKIIASSEANDDLQSRCLLHLALCFEKLGVDEKAREYYNKIKDNFSHMRPVFQITERQLSIRTQRRLEKLKKELAEAKEKSKSDVLENDPLEEKKLISATLHSIAQDYYDDNQLQYAKETLKKSLSFHLDNEKAIALLQQVEKKLITVQDKLFSREDSEYKWLKGLEEKITEENQENFKDILYDFSEILGKNSQVNDYVLKNNFLLLLKNELPVTNHASLANAINFINGNLLVRHNDAFHLEIEKILQSLTKKKHIYYASVVVASGNGLILQKEIRNLNLNFLSAEKGCFYAELDTNNIKDLIAQCYDQGIYLNFFPEVVFLRRNEISLTKTFEVPLVKEYINKKIDFNVYQEGLQFLFRMNYEKERISTLVSTRKINRPFETIPMTSGPLQVPYFMDQTAKIDSQIEGQKSFILLGLLNPIASHYLTSRMMGRQNHRLIAFFSMRKIAIDEFLLKPDIEIDLFAKEDDKHFPQYYDIATWQKVPNLHISTVLRFQAHESRNQFILRLCNEYVKEKTTKTIFRIVRDRLLVYGTDNVHEKIQFMLNGLRENINKLQRFYSYVYLVNDVDKITKNGWTNLESKNSLKVYVTEKSKSEILSSLNNRGQILTQFSPVVCSNTQSIETADYHLKTFWEGIHLEEGKLSTAKVRSVPEGTAIKLTNIFVNDQQNFIEVQSSIFKRNVKQSTYDLNDYSFSIETPKTDIHRGFFRFKHKPNQKYLVTNFKDKKYVFLIVPSKINEKK
ncbi:tetratricopeptide repeat protein [Candidatus Uabimicrobium sp. HlEnr_7]|uniref:tetratricopeptide repeat protein n=1 Tax=Candidatus Uabimicrobium helgolandensis TaxID=3095367 RepID=UPI0035568F04